MKIKQILFLCSWAVTAWPVLSAPHAVSDKVTSKAGAFELQDVRLLEGPFREAMLRDKDYLLKLDADRLLHDFRINVGLASTAKPYGGWEDPKCELRGHSVGHYLSACAFMYASTGDQAIKAKADYIVAELARCQAASPAKGFHEGYLSAFPESFIDRVETAQPVWAPWYTLHKIMAGLLDMYEQCGNKQALDVLVKNTDWVKLRVDHLKSEQMQVSLATEFGGMNEVLANLYAISGNPDHLRLARAFDHRKIFDPLAQRMDWLNGTHANTQIPKIIGAAREYELTGEARYREIAEFFWQRVASKRSYIIGGHSDAEHFFPIEQFPQHLSAFTAETCNTYNMLKLTRHLFAWEPDASYMDFYERGLYNHILASQDPNQGMFVYLMSLKPGHFKTYSLPEDSFWCCVGTGMENHAKYADTIYFRDSQSLYVNLFIPSELTWKERGLVVRQETRFPESDRTRLIFKCAEPVKLALKIRYPSWVAGSMAITVNGARQDVVAAPGSYAAIDREWHEGDRVEICTPMGLHTEELPFDQNQVALLYGPIVLAGELGTEGMPAPYARDQNDFANVTAPTVPVLLCSARDLVRQTEPVPTQPLSFRTKGVGRPHDVTLSPFYKVHHQRYSVYWRLFSEEAWAAREAELAIAETQRKAVEARTVDALRAGEQQPEYDHAMKVHMSQTGEFMDRKWRHATEGGWFSYDLKVLSDQPMLLVCTYWGGDAGQREFDILVDGQKVATQRLEENKPGQFFDQEYRLPEELTRGKSRVTIKFQSLPGRIAGGVFGCKTMKLEK